MQWWHAHIDIANRYTDSDPETDFEGFSEMSDGEYCCLMFISEENVKEKIVV